MGLRGSLQEVSCARPGARCKELAFRITPRRGGHCLPAGEQTLQGRVPTISIANAVALVPEVLRLLQLAVLVLGLPRRAGDVRLLHFARLLFLARLQGGSGVRAGVLHVLEHRVEVAHPAAGRCGRWGGPALLPLPRGHSGRLGLLRGTAGALGLTLAPRRAPPRRLAEGAPRAAARVEVLKEKAALLIPPLALGVEVPRTDGCVADAVGALKSVVAHGGECLVRYREAPLPPSCLGTVGLMAAAGGADVDGGDEGVAALGPRVAGLLGGGAQWRGRLRRVVIKRDERRVPPLRGRRRRLHAISGPLRMPAKVLLRSLLLQGALQALVLLLQEAHLLQHLLLLLCHLPFKCVDALVHLDGDLLLHQRRSLGSQQGADGVPGIDLILRAHGCGKLRRYGGLHLRVCGCRLRFPCGHLRALGLCAFLHWRRLGVLGRGHREDREPALLLKGPPLLLQHLSVLLELLPLLLALAFQLLRPCVLTLALLLLALQAFRLEAQPLLLELLPLFRHALALKPLPFLFGTPPSRCVSGALARPEEPRARAAVQEVGEAQRRSQPLHPLPADPVPG
mmetsp:Transcript_38525/g.122420  ORF Transcript_38525/g.122420 Transcript_38525/m.122420 type:complete len:567 (+) Transcript_38525:364-2064(+)